MIPHLPDNTKYVEPCAGQGYLIKHLEYYGHICVWDGDINTGEDALNLTSQDVNDADYIITNPPWSRPILHELIQHLSSLKPTWLLFDAGWYYTVQSRDLVRDLLVARVPTGRLKWIPGSKMTGKDDNAWHLFDINKTEDYVRSYGR